jgi:thiol:disulfide interchange protein
MSMNEPESVSIWVVLGQLAGGIFFVWAVWTGYNYFKPPVIPPAVPGQYSDNIQWLSIHDGEEEFKKGQKCILYDFTAHWCHFCKVQDAQLFEDKTQAAFINQHFIPITVMDLAREQGKNPADVAELQSKYSVQGFPTLVVRYPNDQYKKIVGFSNVERTIQFLQNAVSSN